MNVFEQVPPGVDFQPYLLDGQQLALRLNRRDLALKLRGKMIRHATLKEDIVAATRHAQALIREAQQAPAQYVDMAIGANGLGEVAGAERRFADARKWFRTALHYVAQAPPSGRRLQILAVSSSNLTQAYVYEVDAKGTRTSDSLFRGAKQSLRFLQQVAQQFREAGNERQYQGFMGNVWDSNAALAATTGALDSARIFKQRAIATFEQLGAAPLVAMRRQHLANLEMQAGNVDKAVAIAQQALAEGEAMQLINVQSDALQMLADAYERQHRPAEALAFFKRATAFRDTVFSADRREEITRLQVQFDTELKESQIRELRQKQKLHAAEAAQQQQRLLTLALTLGLVAIGLTVTIFLALRLRRSREKLAVLAKTKDRLYALVAHDLRGPVQALGSVAGIITYHLRQKDVAAIAELPPLITDSVQQVNQLLDNLLHWAASQTGELSFQPVQLPVQTLLDECAALWSSTAMANQVALELPPAPAGAALWADAQMVRTVLRNLVGNALKFTPTGGTVTLAAEVDARGTTLLVRDTGPGISPSDSAALLQVDAPPDARLRRSGARGEAGTGLGLRLCLFFMRRHGGSLALDGQPGRGTLARAYFPALA